MAAEMISKEAYVDLMARAVRDQFPDEQRAFDISGKHVADQLYATGSLSGRTAPGADEFQFLEAATQTVQFIAAMVATFEAIRALVEKLRKMKKGKAKKEEATKEELLEALWSKQLQSAGIEPEKARALTSKFRSEIVALVK
jgi:hypothetical protein